MQKILVFAGAGASVESDHLSLKQDEANSDVTAIWGGESVDEICSFDAWRLAHARNDARQVMHIHNFHKGMQRLIKECKPNDFHYYIAELSKHKAYDVTIVTTNVDDLFERAGVPTTKIIHLHGSALKRRCPSCQYRFEDTTGIWQTVDQIEQCPRDHCRSRLVKTDVIFYGEQCPDYLASIQSFNALNAGDTAIMVGSSDQTFGVAQRLWERCRQKHVHTININPNHEPHRLFPSDLPLLDVIGNAMTHLELHMRIRRSVEEVVCEI